MSLGLLAHVTSQWIYRGNLTVYPYQVLLNVLCMTCTACSLKLIGAVCITIMLTNLNKINLEITMLGFKREDKCEDNLRWEVLIYIYTQNCALLTCREHFLLKKNGETHQIAPF